ncbi:hypothetical protein ACHQM5_014277 [Ranunculus cassubicifolius]
MKICCLDRTKDRISYLPDPLRCHIVSFLPLEDLIRTSILSRQWEFVCSSLSQLEFNQFVFEKKRSKKGGFRDFVDEMIFPKSSDESISSRHVNAWISFAIQHNVQDLDLHSVKIGKLPHRLFTCNMLMKLGLESVEVEWPLILKFPRLKSLKLDNVKFNGNTVQRLLSSCTFTVLEELSVIFCGLNVSTLSISIPTLKYLEFFDENDTTISVSISTLQEMYWGCCNPPNIIFEDLSALSRAMFDLYQNFDSYDIAIYSEVKYATKILVGLCNVVKLILRNRFLELLSVDQDLSTCLSSSNISNLKRLDLEFCPTSVHFQVITHLLGSYRNLQNVHICVVDLEERAIFLETDDVEESCKLKELPLGDVLNCLKIVKIVDFKGSQIELELVRYLFKNAKYLEKLDISYIKSRAQPNAAEQKRINEVLSTFTRVSPSVSVTLSIS